MKEMETSEYYNKPTDDCRNRPGMTQEELDQLALAIGQNVLLAQKEVLTLEEVAQYTGLKKVTSTN